MEPILIGFPLPVFLRNNRWYPFFLVSEKGLCVIRVLESFPVTTAYFLGQTLPLAQPLPHPYICLVTPIHCLTSLYPHFYIIDHFPNSANFYPEDGTAVFSAGT